MNEFFVNQTILNDNNAFIPATVPLPQNVLKQVVTTPQEVKLILKSLKLGKAAGPDAVNNRILKELALPLSVPLADLFNLSLCKGKVPNIWKEANVTPIKKDDPSMISNYRPIALLSTIGKVLEKSFIKTFLTSLVTMKYLRLCNQVLYPGTLLLTN